MERVYASGDNITGITYFVGNEIEHTPAHGKRTLFVVGTQSSREVVSIALANNVQHIYLGANQSFNLSVLPYGTEDEQKRWDELVLGCLDAGFQVTLDFDIKYATFILESGYQENYKFIPMISAKLPYINQLGYNACIKLDDSDFDASNPGVWVHNLHSLMDRSKFTSWDQYTSDTIIE